MIDMLKEEAAERMEKSLEALKQAFAKLRTGRAHPALLDQVKVSYYGQEAPLSQVANVSVSDARTLTVSPWDKSMVEAIDKAIRMSDLGLNPIPGDVIRVPLPALTEERRKELVRVVKQEAESARVSIRNARRDANQQLKAALKDKLVTEDEVRGSEDAIQKLTDSHIQSIDAMVSEKETDLMSV